MNGPGLLEPVDSFDEWRQALEDGSFEDVYAALHEVVARLEEGRLPLEASLAHYELGVKLGERCNQLLEEAELRISQLDGAAIGATPSDLWGDDSDDLDAFP